jgi:hypothetical protein
MKFRKSRLTELMVLLSIPVVAASGQFMFEVANPAAAQGFVSKTASFVFRTTGCAEPDKASVSATAEGFENGARRSLPLKVMPSAKPGVYAVFQQWSSGRWVVVLKGSCGNRQAGAVIPIGPRGFVREDSKFFTQPANAVEIEAALKAFPEGGYK